MKNILSLLLVFSLVTSAIAQTAVTNNTAQTNTLGGDVLDMKELVFDFGKIPQGKPVTHAFDVVNNDSDSLTISNVQASCGCTTPSWDRDKIFAPKEKTAITVGYNAANEGPFVKLITITYNGGKTKQLTIKGEVWKTPVTSAPENKELESLKN